MEEIPEEMNDPVEEEEGLEPISMIHTRELHL